MKSAIGRSFKSTNFPIGNAIEAWHLIIIWRICCAFIPESAGKLVIDQIPGETRLAPGF